MKSIVTYLVCAVALLVVGGLCLTMGMMERDIARAQRNVAILNYDGAEEVFTRAERYLEYGSYVSAIGKQALNDVRARKASLHYWQRDYDTILPARADDPMSLLPPDNVELQLIAANAIYRSAQKLAKDRQGHLQAVDAGVKAYLVVLKNAERNEDAAFNYEYLVRLRGALLAGQGGPKDGAPGDETNPHGQPGGAPQQTEMNDFKIQIPLEPKEFEDQKNGQEAGKSVARQRKG